MNKWMPALLLTACVSCKNKDTSTTGGTGIKAPPVMNYSILATYPHDTASYTQGLLFYNGELYEGTGNYGFSKLRKIDLKTGQPIREIKLDKKFFGEGIAILRDTVYQLTWREKTVLVYRLSDFAKVRELPIQTEGWGLTTDGTHLIASDGSSTLYYYEPSTFKLVRTQDVTEGGNLSYNLNELEYCNGYLYANQYLAPYIFKIDPATGSVVAKADLTGVWERVKQKDPDAEVPNGIAWDAV
ncbi:MAG: hypothetical protein RJA57_430, partial [Bacteroidota bacterium]